jgi:hypothetical protein
MSNITILPKLLKTSIEKIGGRKIRIISWVKIILC